MCQKHEIKSGHLIEPGDIYAPKQETCGNCDVAGAATKGGAPDEAAVWSSDLPCAQCPWEGKLVCMGEEVKPAQGTDHRDETHSHLWVLCALVSWQDF